MTSFDEFGAAARAQGAGEVLERKYAPNVMIDTHTHSFALQALVCTASVG